MSKKLDMQQQINRLQDNLHSIRKIAGWTAEDLGNKIGVTKQTISNIENHKVKLNQTQYIAIRAVLEYEIKCNPENTKLLEQVIYLLLDCEEEKEKTKEIKNKVDTIAATASGGASKDQISIVSEVLLNSIEGIEKITSNMIERPIKNPLSIFSWLGYMDKNDEERF